MKLDFKTKPTINGVVYYLEIDTTAKTFTENKLCFDGFRITRKELRELKEKAKKDGYTTTD